MIFKFFVIGVILEVTDEGLYKIFTKSGTLSALYSCNQFKVCNESSFNDNDVPHEEISLRGVNGHQSAFGGQGFTKCNCKNKCDSNRCKCKKDNILCNSKCHNSIPCKKINTQLDSFKTSFVNFIVLFVTID